MLENTTSKRKDFLQNCLTLVKMTKGKGIIMSSEASNRIFMRSPLDVVSMGKMIGFNDQ
jgi:RNase P/RNase MRP subunit p30